MRWEGVVLAAVCIMLAPLRAQAGGATCVDDHERAISAEKAGDSRRALEHYNRCGEQSCPAVIRAECLAAAREIERRNAPPPPAPAPAVEPPSSETGVNGFAVAGWSLIGAGAIGLSIFGVYAALGRSLQTDLEQQCAPGCTPAQYDDMRTRYLNADIALGLGLAAAVTGAALLIAGSAQEQPSVALQLSPAGATLGVRF